MALAMASSMILSLTACGGKKKKNNNDTWVKREVVKEDDPYFAVAKTRIDIETDPNKKLEYKDIYNPIIVGDKIVATYNLSYEMPDDVLKKLNPDTTDDDFDICKNYELYEQLTSEYYESGTVTFDMNGNVIEKKPADGLGNVDSVYPQKDGSYLMIQNVVEVGECMGKAQLCVCNKDGEVQKTIPLPTEETWNVTVLVLDNGNILLGYSSGYYLLDPDGNVLKDGSGSDAQMSVYLSGGKVYAICTKYDEKSWIPELTLQEIDPETGELKGKAEKTTIDTWSLVQGMDGVYMIDTTGIKSVDLGTGEKETILDWNWVDYNNSASDLNGLMVKSKDEIVFFETIWGDSMNMKEDGTQISVVTLKRQDMNPHAGKAIIELGALNGVSGDFKNYIVSYNVDPKNQSRIIVRDYGNEIEYDYTDPNVNIEKQFSELSDKIFLELLAGDGPDILMDFSSFNQFNTEEVLVDLNKFIDGNNGLNRSEYFDNVFRAFETKGKMYQIPICIDIMGYISSKDIVGDRKGWTYDEFESIIGSLPSSTSPFQDSESSANFLQSLISVASDSFLDYEKKEVHFDSPEFKKALELSKKYGNNNPVSTDMSAYATDSYAMAEFHDDEKDPLELIANKMLALSSTYIYGLDEIARARKYLNGKEVFIGVPSPDASGMSANPMLTLAISAQSKHQQEAWDFIRFMFNEEQQVEYAKSFNSIPINRAALDKKNADTIEEYKKYNDMFKDVDLEHDVDYSKFGLYPEITQEDLDAFVALIENVTTCCSTDTGIMMIITEETPGYFEGQRSADDVCKNIQNRATTKVHER